MRNGDLLGHNISWELCTMKVAVSYKTTPRRFAFHIKYDIPRFIRAVDVFQAPHVALKGVVIAIQLIL